MEDNLGVRPAGGALNLRSATSNFTDNRAMYEPISRSTTPGVPCPKPDEDDKKRYRARTFPYFQQLPFEVEAESEREAALRGILKQLYIAIKAEDFSPGALHWTRELQAWLNLKFEMTREQRAHLVKLFYSLALSPGLDNTASDKFLRVVLSLTRKLHYLKPGEDLTLDWRPLWEEIKPWVLPQETAIHQAYLRRPSKQLLKLCANARVYFDPRERRAMLEEFLPFFSLNDLSNAYIVIGILNHLLPSTPAPLDAPQSQPRDFFPTIFHLWSLMSRSKVFDTFCIDLLSRVARDHLECSYVPFTEFGIFSQEQSDLIFTAILRLSGIPVGQSSSPYTAVDYMSGAGTYLEKDKKKHPTSYFIARWIACSLSPIGSDNNGSIMDGLEGFIESIETFFHPSNHGGWTLTLSQLVMYLTDGFVSRWNREQSGELDVPKERRINAALKKRFVVALKDATFMGIFSKTRAAASNYYNALHGLAYLEPDEILPGALQRFYPSLQGLVEVHRTTASLQSLAMIASIMCKQKGYRCHITALMALALPGIDANDLHKTMYTLSFIQTVAYSIPMFPLTPEGSHIHDTTLAMSWVQGEMERMEREGQDVKICYSEELSDKDEADILRSSTAGFGEFIITMLGKVFTLLENLPDSQFSARNTPEDSVINGLPAALSPMFASLSPELFDIALDKLVSFVASHVIHQARDAMAWTVNAICKVNPEKCLKAFIPMLIVNIRNEIDQNNAASDRTTGSDYLPRDRALVWHLSMLAMSVVHVGSEVLRYKDELRDIAKYMQDKCRGLPTILISNFIHHLLISLTQTYAIDHALYEPDVIKGGIDIHHWGQTTTPADLTIRWHQPSPSEIDFAVELFESQSRAALEQVELLMSDNPPVSRKGKNKEWSDEFSRMIQQIKLIVAGIGNLFDPDVASGKSSHSVGEDMDTQDRDEDEIMEDDDEPLAESSEDDELRPQFRYKAGYVLQPSDPNYKKLHDIRDDIGRLLSKAHAWMIVNQEDDVNSFTALYTAFRTWITDVGIERSAHPMERHAKLYKADIAAFKIKGLRKIYPRPLLIKRAESYQMLRIKHNAQTRQKSDIDKQLLLDLSHSCMSLYADVRRTAQSCQDSALKVLIGGKPLVIPGVLQALRKAIDELDHDRVKGALYTLMYTSLLRTLLKDWRFAPDMLRMYIEAAGIDKPSIQQIAQTALYMVVECGKPFDSVIILNHDAVDTIKPDEDVSAIISKRYKFIQQRRDKVEAVKADLGEELVQTAKGAHWKIATRCAIFATNLCLRFQKVASSSFVDLVVQGAIDPHPGLRNYYLSAFSSLFTNVDLRAVYGHDYRNFLMGKEINEKNRLRIPVEKGDGDFTQKFIDNFASTESPEYLVDADHPGWLVWGKDFTAYRAKPLPFDTYDEVENATREHLGRLITRDWVKKAFEYLKQEPRDQSTDRFRMTNVYMLMHVFDLMYYGKTAVTFEDVKELTLEVFEDGSDKHQHRATSEILGALLAGSIDDPVEMRNRSWEFAAPMFLKILAEGLTPESLSYWLTCLHLILDSKDPRRAREIVDGLKSFRLDMSSNAAFKESAKIQMLDFVIADAGWHFRHEQPLLDNFLAHIDHPYKAVREAMGRVISIIYKTRYHESFKDVTTLLEKNKAASSIGIRPYKPTEEFTATMNDVLQRLEKWRQERPAGEQNPTPYTSGSKTVLIWLDCTLSSHECTQLVPFFVDYMIQFLHMMDIKEDPELMRLAYHVYRHLPNVPIRSGEDKQFIQGLVEIGKSATVWHQRLRALVNIQVVFFRRIFLTAKPERDQLISAVSDMLRDPQMEVRTTASTTLAGMIRCSPKKIRGRMVDELKARFEQELRDSPIPKPRRAGTETPVDRSQAINRRHAAVLGLGALIEAFPYATPPPHWMPEVLATLARKTSGDPGMVGKTTKGILSDFKKTRQDSWNVDQKVKAEFPRFRSSLIRC